MIELRQTRNVTAREERVLYDLWRRALWPAGGGAAYTAAYYLWHGLGAFLLVSIVMAVGALDDVAPDRAAQLVVATAGFGAAHLFRAWQEQRIAQKLYAGQRQAGDRYVLEQDGLHVMLGDARIVYTWSSIIAVHNHEKWLVALISRNGAVLIAKDAFEGQDLAAFGRALEARAI